MLGRRILVLVGAAKYMVTPGIMLIWFVRLVAHESGMLVFFEGWYVSSCGLVWVFDLQFPALMFLMAFFLFSWCCDDEEVDLPFVKRGKA